MSKIKYPFPGLSKKQRAVLDEIACGNDCGHHPATILALKLAGLIKECSPKVVGKDRFGLIEIPQYEMPIDKHVIWCEYQDKVFRESVGEV